MSFTLSVLPPAVLLGGAGTQQQQQMQVRHAPPVVHDCDEGIET